MGFACTCGGNVSWPTEPSRAAASSCPSPGRIPRRRLPLARASKAVEGYPYSIVSVRDATVIHKVALHMETFLYQRGACLIGNMCSPLSVTIAPASAVSPSCAAFTCNHSSQMPAYYRGHVIDCAREIVQSERALEGRGRRVERKMRLTSSVELTRSDRLPVVCVSVGAPQP